MQNQNVEKGPENRAALTRQLAAAERAVANATSLAILKDAETVATELRERLKIAN